METLDPECKKTKIKNINQGKVLTLNLNPLLLHQYG